MGSAYIVLVGSGLEAEIASWWERWAAHELLESGFAQIDIDELVDDPPQRATAEAVKALEVALGIARRFDPATMGLVTIPLEPSGTLVTDSPNVAELFATAWIYGLGRVVPGIYLLSPSIHDAMEHEDFRLDLTDSTGVLPDGFTAYYRCWRTEDEAARGWEYDRTVYVRST
jgi:hypothetical protein